MATSRHEKASLGRRSLCWRRAVVLSAAGSVLLCCSGVPGCAPAEPPRVKVAGRVLLDGEPLEAGSIRFVPEHGRPSGGTIERDGRFQLTSATVGQPIREGVLIGKYKVAVSTAQIVDDETAEWIAPQKYANHLTSGIEVEVEQPTNSLIIELSSEVAEVADDQPTDDDASTPPKPVKQAAQNLKREQLQEQADRLQD